MADQDFVEKLLGTSVVVLVTPLLVTSMCPMHEEDVVRFCGVVFDISVLCFGFWEVNKWDKRFGGGGFCIRIGLRSGSKRGTKHYAFEATGKDSETEQGSGQVQINPSLEDRVQILESRVDGQHRAQEEFRKEVKQKHKELRKLVRNKATLLQRVLGDLEKDIKESTGAADVGKAYAALISLVAGLVYSTYPGWIVALLT